MEKNREYIKTLLEPYYLYDPELDEARFDIDEFHCGINEVCKHTVIVPNDKNGEQIKIGQQLWGEDGEGWIVEGFCEGHYSVIANHAPGEAAHKHLKPEWLSHKKPLKTKKQIVKEMRAQADAYRNKYYPFYTPDAFSSVLSDFADQLEKAEK